jgi:hypothetical protein
MSGTISSLPFRDWFPWKEMKGQLGLGDAGVYLLGNFPNELPRNVQPIDSRVIYVGETVNQSFTKRLRQFSHTAFQRKHGHSGGWRFSELFAGNRVSSPQHWLFVSILPVRMEGPCKSAYIRYVERWILWEYVQRFNDLPCCNRK